MRRVNAPPNTTTAEVPMPADTFESATFKTAPQQVLSTDCDHLTGDTGETRETGETAEPSHDKRPADNNLIAKVDMHLPDWEGWGRTLDTLRRKLMSTIFFHPSQSQHAKTENFLLLTLIICGVILSFPILALLPILTVASAPLLCGYLTSVGIFRLWLRYGKPWFSCFVQWGQSRGGICVATPTNPELSADCHAADTNTGSTGCRSTCPSSSDKAGAEIHSQNREDVSVARQSYDCLKATLYKQTLASRVTDYFPAELGNIFLTRPVKFPLDFWEKTDGWNRVIIPSLIVVCCVPALLITALPLLFVALPFLLTATVPLVMGAALIFCMVLPVAFIVSWVAVITVGVVMARDYYHFKTDPSKREVDTNGNHIDASSDDTKKCC